MNERKPDGDENRIQNIVVRLVVLGMGATVLVALAVVACVWIVWG